MLAPLLFVQVHMYEALKILEETFSSSLPSYIAAGLSYCRFAFVAALFLQKQAK